MIGLLWFVVAVLASPFKSKIRLEAENAALRHQLVVLRRQLKGRVRLTNDDRWFFVQLYRWFPSILPALMIIRPETLVRWHRAGFRRYWRWQSRRRGGRPPIELELRALIQQMSTENWLWGASRIHGELLKLGFEVAQSSVAKYMVKRRGPPSQGWRTFLRNHTPEAAAMDLFVVPTIGFKLLCAFVILRLDRRDLVWINVTTNPTAEWVARQITEAFPWDMAPRYMIRDRDRIHGAVVARRLRAMGIRDQPIAPASPWQNGFVERLIGSIRRECLDHAIICGEAHLRRVLKSHTYHYNNVRTHRSLKGRASLSRGLADRCHRFTPHPWWTSSPLQPGLGFRYTQAVRGDSAGAAFLIGESVTQSRASQQFRAARLPGQAAKRWLRDRSRRNWPAGLR
jgi:transposase InsO family protein